jgi:hypothetical protein
MEETTFDPIAMRREEVAAYASNIAMYQNIISTLPTEWPEHLLPYKAVANLHDVIEQIENMDDVALVSQLHYAEQCRRLMRSEMIEMTKAQSILNALEAQA